MDNKNTLHNKSDIAAYLTSRYNTFLKNKEIPPGESEVLTEEPSEAVSESIENETGAQVEDINDDLASKPDKINRFYQIISETLEYPSKEKLKFEYNFSDQDLDLLKQSKISMINDYDNDLFEKINLPTEDNGYLFFYKKYAYQKITDLFNIYIDQKDHFESDDFEDMFTYNLLISELKNGLEIEGQYHIKRKIDNIINQKKIEGPEEQLVYNMNACYEYIKTNPITEENLFELHTILNKNLSRKEIQKYRHGDIDILGKLGNTAGIGAAPSNIEKYMHKLFVYIDYSLKNPNALEAYIASIVIHYYFIYISPYFKNNFRMARLLSQWYLLNHSNMPYKPLFINEAINQDLRSKKYLKAIEDAWEHNDITYFINYVLDITFKYFILYLNLSNISNRTLSSGIELSNGEEGAIKTILSMPYLEGGYFDWKRYKKFDQSNLSKQYYNRILNHLEDKDILGSLSKNNKLYRLKFEKYDLLKMKSLT